MKCAVISLTKNGAELATGLGQKLNADVFVRKEFLKEDCREGIFAIHDRFSAFVGEIFCQYDALVFIMACGIVVRTIAPYIKDKKTDPAVLVLDEKGQNVISLLSGHVGGANELTAKVARMIGGNAVITTSTDVNRVIAWDVFAKENHCVIEDFDKLKQVSADLVNGKELYLYSEYPFDGDIPDYLKRCHDVRTVKQEWIVRISNNTENAVECENTLYIRPENLIMGIGCRKGITKEELLFAVQDFIKINHKSILSLKCAASIDIKADEKGLLEFCKDTNLELRLISREEILKVEENYTKSGFAKEKVGVASVAEPCAVLAGRKAKLICKKTRYKGITFALAEEETVLKI